jgi:hypothetical protein
MVPRYIPPNHVCYHVREQVETQEALCTSVHYSPAAPYDLAVSCGTHVSLRSGVTGAKLRAISRFNGGAYSGVFR